MVGERKNSKAGVGGGATQDADTQPKIVWDDSEVLSLYSNIAQVKASREEIMLLFGASRTAQADQNELRVQLSERIVLNPVAAKRLAIRLDNAIREYESRFGYLDGNALLQESLEPTPPLQPPPF
jgi:hypothetical protein